MKIAPIRGRVRIKRENWKEWFGFVIHEHHLEEFREYFGWQEKMYFSFKEPWRLTVRFYAWPLWPLIKTYRGWFWLARWCFTKHLLRRVPEPGTVIPFWWPKYFI